MGDGRIEMGLQTLAISHLRPAWEPKLFTGMNIAR
jgi:hypothetical protein